MNKKILFLILGLVVLSIGIVSAECEMDSDCSDGLFCVDGFCSEEEGSDDDSLSAFDSSDGSWEACEMDSDCSDSLFCVDGFCSEEEGSDDDSLSASSAVTSGNLLTSAQCNDYQDNDGDGEIDYGGGCDCDGDGELDSFIGKGDSAIIGSFCASETSDETISSYNTNYGASVENECPGEGVLYTSDDECDDEDDTSEGSDDNSLVVGDETFDGVYTIDGSGREGSECQEAIDCLELYDSRYKYICEDGVCMQDGLLGKRVPKVSASGVGFGAAEDEGFFSKIWEWLFWGRSDANLETTE